MGQRTHWAAGLTIAGVCTLVVVFEIAQYPLQAVEGPKPEAVKPEPPKPDLPGPETKPEAVVPPEVAKPDLSKTPPNKVELPSAPKTAPSKVTTVTVYQNSALVTREVEVPEGTGPVELVVTPLPPQTIDKTLYSEGTDGILVLTTRYRTRPIEEDTREEVRKAEAKLKSLRQENEKLQSDSQVIQKNLDMLAKLENFTGANLQQMTEKGNLNSEGIMALAKYLMETRTEKSQALVGVQQKLQENQEQTVFAQRQQQDLTAGSSKTERDAVIIVDKKNPGPGKVRLNYLVDSASWRPQYKFRSAKENQAIQVEYLAAIVQQTGEDWTHANLVLSTAEPMLNAAPPDLQMLAVAAVPRPANQTPLQSASGPMPGNQFRADEFKKQAVELRSKAQKEYTANNSDVGGKIINDAAALEQAKDLLATKEEELKEKQQAGNGKEGPTVTYHLGPKLTVPSRNDEQIIEVAKIEMAPEYFYKAVPVLTSHVYRLANLTNKSEYVLLPGEATMYIGTDFVGRANLPLVAIGEQFTAGFGVDPQLQVERTLMDKTRTNQGDNQVLRYQYRILVNSYKTEPVKLQVWDRLPHAESEIVGVSMVKASPEISTDALYLRESRPNNLLRWDMNVEPSMNGEKAIPIDYEFKLELGRQMMLSNFLNIFSY